MSQTLPPGSFPPAAGPTVRRAPAAAAAKATRPTGQAILSTLDIQVPHTPPPAGYGWALAGVATFLVVISAVYLALLAFLGWLLAWHVFQTFVSLRHGPYFIFHLPMALLAGTLLLFLVKPVFFRRKPGKDGVIALQPEDEPLLFAFVNKLADATGARRPDLIEIDCEPNAHARLKRTGITGAIGKGLVLRFGLPLVAAMTVRQFAGVLAHELGHFRQTGGMKGSYLIRLQVAFFARVVFERDRLDEKLERLRYSRNRLGRIVFWAAGWMVEAARGVLWLLMTVGEMLTCGVLRRMEFDADRLEAEIAGTRAFLTTSRLMLFLSIAARRARYDLADAWEQRRLADDLPRLIVAHARQLAEHKADILKLQDEEQTGWFDTHPCHAERRRAVEAAAAPGLLACDVAAKVLFRDFNAQAKDGSVALYRAILDTDLDAGKLVPTAELVEQRKGERENFKALRRFFRHGMVATRPILPTAAALDPAAPGEEQAEIDELVAARGEMLALADAAGAAAEQYQSSGATCVVNRVKISLAGLFYSAGANKLSNAANRELRKHDPLRLKSLHGLIPFEASARRRLTAGMRLAQTPPWGDPSAEVTSGNTTRPLTQLLGLVHLLQPYAEPVERVREIGLSIQMFMSAYDDANPHPPLVNRIIQLGQEAAAAIGKFRAEMADIPYPFAHGTAGISVADALVEKAPKANDPVEVHGACNALVDRYYDLLYRATAELTTHAERIERAVGLEPLTDLEPRQDKAAEAEEKAQTRRNTRRYWTGYSLRAAGGIAMLLVMVWMSVSPPELPSLGWGKSRGVGGYRPAGFSASSRSYSTNYYSYAPPPTPSYPRGYNGGGYNPQVPGYPNANQPNYGQPNYGQPNQPNFGNPRFPQPGGGGGYTPPQPGGYRPPTYTPYQPSSPSRGGSPGGGGSSPGGPPGGGGRR
ncbi:MAG: M48 family metallopeptidase [Phycisphaerae bacterium]